MQTYNFEHIGLFLEMEMGLEIWQTASRFGLRVRQSSNDRHNAVMETVF